MREENSLKNKTIIGLFWSFFEIIANQGIQFIIQIFLARLLLPADFGVIGMITVFIAISQTFIDSGISSALIREKEIKQEDLSTIFYFNLFMAGFLYIVLFLSAHAISSYFKEPQLVLILRVLALILIINSFGITQRTILVRKINFKTQTKISIISSVVSGIIAIILAFMGFGVWSLVMRTLLMQLIQSSLLCYLNRWVPSLVFRMTSFRRLFAFGWKLLASSLIDTLYRNIYYLIIGKIFSAEELGYYTNAQKLRDMASQSITSSVQKVSYPVLSSIQNEKERLKSGYQKIIKNTVFFTFPVILGLTAVADPLIRFLYGSKWIPSIPIFQLLCLAGILYPLHALNLDVLQVKGRSDLFLGLEIVKKAIAVLSILIVLFLKLGIMGLLWATVFVSFIAYFINSFFSVKLLSYSAREQIKDILPVFINSILMGIVVAVCGKLLPFGLIIKLAIQILTGIVFYIAICRITKIEEFNTMYTLLHSAIKKILNAAKVTDGGF
jgi:Membrane protein involved in the export of O-antigen and teichoic acid